MNGEQIWMINKLKDKQLGEWQRKFIDDLDTKHGVVLSHLTNIKLQEVFIEVHYNEENPK